MCIVCQIKKVADSNILEESEKQYLMKRVELLATLALTFSEVIETMALGGSIKLDSLDDLRFSAGACFSSHDNAPQAIEDILQFMEEQEPKEVTKH